ncbi:hypothetical protein [Deinococcus sp. QL22]|uniref:hypothetical protein n=1 Tax=Deinococcus sp. QL22 TaxID=2939437 RepID=UPI002016F93F|nr:hypothetical protein [Deinococcus sp. QL22]UQN09232.1 hypothetical protein M1R55_24700 [Deinococcus sp. QL22]
MALQDQVADGSTPAQQTVSLRVALIHLAEASSLFSVTYDAGSDAFCWRPA